MKISSLKLELQVLRTLTDTKNKKHLAKLASSLNPECFHTKKGKEIYQRLMVLARERGLLVSWSELQHDIVLRDTTRQHLEKVKIRPLTDRSVIQAQVNQLHNYRRLRALYDTTKFAVEQMSRDNINVDTLYAQIADKLMAAGRKANVEADMVHIGQDDKQADKLLKSILSSNAKRYIPTGIASFDNINRGVMRKSFWTIAAASGSGKTAVANLIAGNMAQNGARVCLVQLEMDHRETGQRQASRIASVAMEKFHYTEEFSTNTKRKIAKRWRRFHRRIKRSNGLLTILAPSDDLSFEEIMFTIRPYEYDIVVIDYLSLLRGLDGERAWQEYGKITRFGKRFAVKNNMIVCCCAQLNDDNLVKYSRAIFENSDLAWRWNYDQKSREAKIIKIDTPKSRQYVPLSMLLKEDFRYMRVKELKSAERKAYQNQESESTQNKGKTNQQRIPKNHFAEAVKKEKINDGYVKSRTVN